MRYNVLVTGSSGRLGKSLISNKSDNFVFLTPSRSELDITNKPNVEDYFKKNKIDAVIHCAALTDMKLCETNPNLAIDTNSSGTAYLVEACNKSKIRFMYISTDYVYPCVDGNYNETSKVEPFNVYAWTKFLGELFVRNVENHCIIRTSFFDPNNIPFDTSFTDSFCSKIPVQELSKEIIKILEGDFIGTINVGQDRISLYNLYKEYKPSIKPELLSNLKNSIKRAVDSSLDITLFKGLKSKGYKNGN
jgi:dTDP-4-dehydrorhamnose reductase